jgi:hypothetical protein
MAFRLVLMLALAAAVHGQEIWRPGSVTPIHWQWQLGRTFDLAADVIPGVTVYGLDGFDTPATTVAALKARGCRVIAYFSFGSFENWRPDSAAFPASVKGKDNGWPGEKWLDIRNLAALAPIMQARMDIAREKGFDALEPDNIDGFSNATGFPLTAQHQLEYNRWIATQCHQRGLAVALKNDVEQVEELEPHYDFALNEEAFRYDEWDRYSVFTRNNKAVFNVEYRAGTPQASALNAARINSLTRDLNLVSPRDNGYIRKPCLPDNQKEWAGVIPRPADVAPARRPSTRPTAAPPTPAPSPPARPRPRELQPAPSPSAGDRSAIDRSATPAPSPEAAPPAIPRAPLHGWHAANDALTLTLGFEHAAAPWDFLRAYIDTDRRPTTGLAIGGLGADLFIENGRLHVRDEGAWRYQKTLTEQRGDTSVAWTLPRADAALEGFPAAADVVFQVAAAGGPALTSPPWTFFLSASDGPIAEYHARNDPRALTYSARYTRPLEHRRVYVDADGRATTGFGVQSIGADFLVGDATVFRHAAPRGDTWRWVPVGPARREGDGQVTRWHLDRALVGAQGPLPIEQALVFEGLSGDVTYDTPPHRHALTP